ncbi:MAG: R3H domain-containing nucleic acid-binding protein [Fimbriimonadales bacterium]
MNSNRNELEELLQALPPIIQRRIREAPDVDRVIEIVIDYGRPAEIRFMDRYERLDDYPITESDIAYVTDRVGQFGGDNRAGIERTLHRISAIRSRTDRIVGLTCRVGRAVQGTIDIIQDIVESSKSILFLGKPGVGKTTKLREVARMLADDLGKRVVIVDTSNEIAGDGDIPHPSIGSARRMQVKDPSVQHQVMIEAVENHMPEVIVIDEIGVEAEAYAARTIAERGVQLVGTAHGRTLENLMLNPTLCDLVGGIQAVTLSDDEAKRRGTQKTVLERKAPPTFDAVVELIDYDKLAIHHDAQKQVDLILRGVSPRPEIRIRTEEGRVEVVQAAQTPEPIEPYANGGRSVQRRAEREPAEPVAKERPNQPLQHVIRVFPYGIARTRLERAIRERRAQLAIANDLNEADVVMAIRTSMQKKPGRFTERLGRSIPTVVVRSNTLSQIATALDEILGGSVAEPGEVEEEARSEVLGAIDFVRAKGRSFELAPRPGTVRRMQHQEIESHKLRSESVGQEPNRRVRILPAAI